MANLEIDAVQDYFDFDSIACTATIGRRDRCWDFCKHVAFGESEHTDVLLVFILTGLARFFRGRSF